MSYTLTPEQQDILTTATNLYSNPADESHLLKVSAVAGAAKSYTLIKVAESLPHTSQLYLAYNKSIADEAKSKFPSYVDCKTTHSLAYTPIIKYGLDLDGYQGKPRIIGNFTYRDITEKVDYDQKLLVINHLTAFFLSKHTSVSDYLDASNEEDPKVCKLVEKYFLSMVANKLLCTHAFYLKMYHILLVKGHIHYDRPFDLLMLDEAGDLNEVTLAIFLALPAVLKIMVGDPYQNIYSFNHTINGFKALKHIGITKTLSTSFRCSTAIADLVESFCQRHLDEDFVFRGVDHPSHTINTEAIISRTNSGLIEYMIKLTASDIPFSLTRSPKEIFADMLTLMNLKPGVKIHDPALKFIQSDVDDYFSSTTTQRKFKTCLSYINELYAEEEPTIKIAAKTIFTYGASTIYEAYKYAKKCDESHIQHPLTLTTAHSSKGLMWDAITLANDFDLDDILEMTKEERQPTDIEEIRLYYVAVTRARLQINNMKYLHK